MKIPYFLTTAASCFAGLATILAQGPTEPVGAPGETMKTLQQVEPRTDVATLLSTGNAEKVINQSGSYYLSDNLDVTETDGIAIEASGVTLDLNGFTIYRSSEDDAKGTAIELRSAVSNVVVKNGSILGGVTFNPDADGDQYTGPGFDNGIQHVLTDPSNVRIIGITVKGMDDKGIEIPGATIEDCQVDLVAGVGIEGARILNSIARQCGDIGIVAADLVSHCDGQGVKGGIDCEGDVDHSSGTADALNSDGIYAYGNVSHSIGQATGNNGRGIEADGSVDHSRGVSDDAEGIYSDGNVQNSTGFGVIGIFSDGNVLNCLGTTIFSEDGSHGIRSLGNVTGSKGIAQLGPGDGINADHNVHNCYGEAADGDGIQADGNVSDSHGKTTSDNSQYDGIEGRSNVSNSVGLADEGAGINASGNVSNSEGETTSDSGSDGIHADNNVTNSYGRAAGTGDGIHGKTVSYSRGNSAGSGVGIRANIGIGCTVAGGEAITNEYLMP